MPIPGTAFPRGLVGLLELRGEGRAPYELGDLITPTIDLQEFYRVGRREQVSAGTAALAVGANLFAPTIQVPSNEVWVLEDFTCQIVLGAGTAVDAASAGQYNQGGITQPFGPNVAGAGPGEVRTRIDRVRWLSPGSTLGCFVQSFTGVITATGFATLVRLRV